MTDNALVFNGLYYEMGDGGGIRTSKRSRVFPVFKTGAFNHSATHPCNSRQIVSRRRDGNETDEPKLKLRNYRLEGVIERLAPSTIVVPQRRQSNEQKDQTEDASYNGE